jgi:carbamoyltransferase
MSKRILGVSAYYHDSAACLVETAGLSPPAQEERFTRIKHDAEFPTHAVEYCLSAAGISASQLDLVGFYEKPLVKFSRLLETYIACAPRGIQSYWRALPLWLSDKLLIHDDIRSRLDGYAGEILFGEHHESHAASAFYPSPFEDAAVVTIDGVGEWATSSIGRAGARDRDSARDAVPALAGPALLCLHLLHRLQGEFRRVQSDGPCPVWQAGYVKLIAITCSTSATMAACG